MVAVPFRVIRAQPFLRPPLTRYKREGYLCPEWYHRARSTPVPCTGIQFTGSSTLLDQAVSFIHRPRTRLPRPEFLIIRRTFTKVSESSRRRRLRNTGKRPWRLFKNQRTLRRDALSRQRDRYCTAVRIACTFSRLCALFGESVLLNIFFHRTVYTPTRNFEQSSRVNNFSRLITPGELKFHCAQWNYVLL